MNQDDEKQSWLGEAMSIAKDAMSSGDVMGTLENDGVKMAEQATGADLEPGSQLGGLLDGFLHRKGGAAATNDDSAPSDDEAPDDNGS